MECEDTKQIGLIDFFFILSACIYSLSEHLADQVYSKEKKIEDWNNNGCVIGSNLGLAMISSALTTLTYMNNFLVNMLCP